MDSYKETGITYDLVGNITALNRFQNGTQIDQLAYTYITGTNQLQTVVDGNSSNSGLASGTTTYSWDGNGNMLSSTNTVNIQQNKSFTYNILNLPIVATIPTGTITYTYDATGNKLRKVTVLNGITKTTDYINGIEYDNSTTTIGFIQTEEGKVVPISAGYDYTYYLGDNLGDTRITFDTKTGSATTQQKDDYYPFGLEISRDTIPNPKNEYLYNKKELQEEFTEYDYGARLYDPVIGRWNAPDMLAELSYNLTPYRYCYNNPVNFIDPYGLWESTAGGYTTTDKKDIERFLSYLQTESSMKVTPNFDQASSFIKEEKAGGIGKLTDGSKLLDPINILRYNKMYGDHGFKVDQKSFSNFWYQVQGDLTPNALDPRTWHNNIFGLSYAGKDNPKTYRGDEIYTKMPDQIEDIPAYVHDIDYNKVGARGFNSLVNDPRTQGANVKLVNSEMVIAIGTPNPLTRVRALAVAGFIAYCQIYNVFSNSLKFTQ